MKAASACLSKKVKREMPLREIARASEGAGMSCARACKGDGLSRPDAGPGNRALVAEGYAERLEEGVYRKTQEGYRRRTRV